MKNDRAIKLHLNNRLILFQFHVDPSHANSHRATGIPCPFFTHTPKALHRNHIEFEKGTTRAAPGVALARPHVVDDWSKLIAVQLLPRAKIRRDGASRGQMQQQQLRTLIYGTSRTLPPSFVSIMQRASRRGAGPRAAEND